MNAPLPEPGALERSREWRTWNTQEWNERLLDYYFARKGGAESESPVVVLLVTAEELARATGDPAAEPDEVRRAFVRVVQCSVQRTGSLLDHASDYLGWPGVPIISAPPPFVIHLLFTCIAASESSEELADETSFVARLRDLTMNQLPESSLQRLPILWENLRNWLRGGQGRYRPLVLPDPGGLRRIGYTVKMAFPDRRDQRQLSELLDHAGLAGHEPPVGRVLSLVASERGRFRRSFLLAFDEFRRLFDASPGRAAPRLVEHRFWAAVREASLRGRGQAEFSDVAVRVSLLGEEEEDRLVLFAAADQRTKSAAVEFADLPVGYGQWRFALIPQGGGTLDARRLEQITRAILDGSLRLPRLSSHVDQGLLPFVTAAHGLLELAGQEQLGEVSVALVRKGMVPDLLRILGGSASTIRPSSYDGWVQVHDPQLRTIPFAELDGTSLSRTWILHECLIPTAARLLGGVRAEDGWLGVHEVLPRVVARGALSVVLEGPEGELALTSLGNDTWAFPPRDLAGEFTLIASLDGGEDRRTIRFHATPTSEAFKPPSDPEAWIEEEVSGTGTLSNSLPFVTEARDDDCERLCERIAYLAADVGAFVECPGKDAWRIAHFAGRFIGARGAVRGEAAIPSNQVVSAHARRRWRKMLFESAPSWSDPDFDKARRQVRATASAHAHLPRLELEQSVPDLAPMKLPSPSDAADRLVRIVSGRASARSGIDWREWAKLAQRVLDIDARLLERVTRAWMEAGLIDIASCARWWHRAVFARLPRLVAFRLGDGVGAALSGLVLATTLDEVRRTALGMGTLVEDRFSVSPLVPRTVSLRAPNARSIEELAGACRIGLHWLDVGHLARGVSSRHDGTSAPPEHYERVTRWLHWSLKKGEYPEVSVEHHMRRDRPDYWVASRDGRRLWFYDLNVARAWAAAFLGEPMVNVVGDAFLDANHAFLPLPLARAVSVLGSGLSGPTDAGTYRYPVGASQLRELVLDIVTRTFEPSRLAVSATEKATG